MYMFILGVVFGVGLVLAYREVEFQIWLHSQRRISKPESTISLACGCHDDLVQHEEWMKRGTTAVPRTSTPDEEW